MEPQTAREMYVRVLKQIISSIQDNYDINYLASWSDEHVKRLLEVKLSILGYG